jgi:excinuclease UvrABC nuclease subunit
MEVTHTKTCSWPGRSGTTYKYEIYLIGADFKEKGGNYIFCKKNAEGYWAPQYIGQAKNLNERLGSHEREVCAKRNGATHIHAHLNPTEAARLAEEMDLIHNFNPPCNKQHVH